MRLFFGGGGGGEEGEDHESPLPEIAKIISMVQADDCPS